MAKAVSISVTPLTPHKNALVHVTRVDLSGDYLKIEIENATPNPVMAVWLGYRFSGCFPGEGSISGGDGKKRIPGAHYVDIPAHSRVWYLDDHMASRLALAAILQKTRYIQRVLSWLALFFRTGMRFALTHGIRTRTTPRKQIVFAKRGCGTML
jgi:hypothetical protein